MSSNDVAFPVGTPVGDFRLLADGPFESGTVIGARGAERVVEFAGPRRVVLRVEHLIRTDGGYQEITD